MTELDRRKKNQNWQLGIDSEGCVTDVSMAHLAVLMDIRDELQSINRSLNCFRIPRAFDDLNALGKWARRRPRKAKA